LRFIPGESGRFWKPKDWTVFLLRQWTVHRKPLDDLYVSRNETEQGEVAAAQTKASNEVSAASLVAEGDSAFAKGDYPWP